MVDLYSNSNLNVYNNRDLSRLSNNTRPLNNNVNPFIKQQSEQDTFESSKNLQDDGIISTEEKVKNLGKGIVKPITDMFSSKENFLIGAGMLVGGTILTAATGGAILPLFAAAGAAIGTVQLGKSAYAAANAQTDKEAIEAWQGIGEGMSISALSITGAKSSLKSAGVNTENLNSLKATAKCFGESKNSFLNSVKSFATGEYRSNLGFKPKYKEKTTIRYVSEDEVPSWAKAAYEENAEVQSNPNPAINNETEVTKRIQSEAPKLLNEPKSIVKGKDIETLIQEYDSAKAKFIQENKQNLPSYQERYQEILELTGGDHNWAKAISEENNYLDYKFSLTPQARELKLSLKLKSLNEQELINFNKAKMVLDERNIKYDDYTLASSGEILSDISAGVFSKDNFALGHKYAKVLNPYLHNGSLNQQNLYKTFLDEGFKTVNPLSEEITVYKKVNKNLLNLHESDVVTDKGYLSSSITKKSAAKGNDDAGCIARINVPKGSKISYDNTGIQSECLFPCNAQFKVVKPYNPQTGEIELEYILP